jgi:hypothetical protein
MEKIEQMSQRESARIRAKRRHERYRQLCPSRENSMRSLLTSVCARLSLSSFPLSFSGHQANNRFAFAVSNTNDIIPEKLVRRCVYMSVVNISV